MPKITSEMYVVRGRWVRYSRQAPRGSGYCADQTEYQCLMKRWKLWGFTVWKREIDRETIPSHVSISMGCFGDYTGDWVSKFRDHIPKRNGGFLT